MNTYNFDVSFTTGKIYGPDLLLVVNDHNSTTFKFTFDQEGRYVFKLLYPDNTIYVQDIVDGELVLTKGVLNQEGNYKFEISLYGDDNRLTTARIKEFPVRLELVETDEPVKADDRLPILDNLIEETNKVVEAAKNGEFDGATFTPSVSEDGDLSWSNDKGKENPPTVNIKGEKGDPGAVKMQVVDTLPEVGETDTIYLLKKDTPGERNLYDEYVYTETTGWEHIGDTSVDLTDYYTKEETDEKLDKNKYTLPIASADTLGGVKIGDGLSVDEDGVVKPSTDVNAIFLDLHDVLEFPNSTVSTSQNGTLPEKYRLLIEGMINDALAKGAKPRTFNIPNNLYIIAFKNYYMSLGTQSESSNLYGSSYILWTTSMLPIVGDGVANPQCSINFKLTYDSSTNTVTLTGAVSATLQPFPSSVSRTWVNNNFLSKKNTDSYTPTSNYHPATKKYVDDGLGTKIGENQFVFAKTFNGNDNTNYARLFYQSGCTDSEVCSYFGDILTKMYTNAQGTYYNQISGILLLTLPNINNGFCGVFEYYSTTRKFYSVNTEYNRSIVYEIEWTGSIDDDKKEITVSNVKINSDYIKTDTPTDNQHVANKKYVDDTIDLTAGVELTSTYEDDTLSIQLLNGNGQQLSKADVSILQGASAYNGTDGALLVNNTEVYTPSTPYNPATKHYVDEEHYKTIQGYDAEKQQMLTHAGGIFVWKDIVE